MRKVATTRRGSKQGSILGGVLFELWMDEALCEMDDEEEDETELWYSPKDSYPWKNDMSHTDCHSLMNDDNMKRMVELTYPDDENILGCTPRPQEIGSRCAP